MLQLNFAMSFAPERHYLSALMKFIRRQQTKVSISEISDYTGIPNGESTGKVSPHLKYLQGMHIIVSNEEGWYKLTEFGKAVCKYDRAMTDPITGWSCSMFMCDEDDGALLYREALKVLAHNNIIDRTTLVSNISEALGNMLIPDRVLTPFLGFYTNDSAFSGSKILTIEKDKIIFHPAPTRKNYIPMYGAFICHLLYKHFPDRSQVTTTEFLKETGFCLCFNMTEQIFNSILDSVAGEGYIKVSRLVSPPVISSLRDSKACWDDLYSNNV